MATDTSAPRVEANKFKNGFSPGKVLKIKNATMEMCDRVFTESVDSAGPFAVIGAELTTGSINMKTWFEREGGSIIPAYYSLLEKM